MKKLICNAFYSKNLMTKSPGINNNVVGFEIYLKNIFESLVSAKLNNATCDVALITNINNDCSTIIKKLKEQGIMILKCPFNNFVMPDYFKWEYAFYKLNVLEYISKLQYDRYLLLDADTFVVGALDDLWEESKERILLYDTKHGLSHPVRKSIKDEWFKIMATNLSPIQWGGEFLCMDNKSIKDFVIELNIIFNKIKKTDYCIDSECGDEMLISFVAEILSFKVRPANAYIERFWNRRYYLVSTVWNKDSVLIWHLPADKKYGMIDIYNYYNKNHRFPDKESAAKILNLPKSQPGVNMSMLKYYIKKIREKMIYQPVNKKSMIK